MYTPIQNNATYYLFKLQTCLSCNENNYISWITFTKNVKYIHAIYIYIYIYIYMEGFCFSIIGVRYTAISSLYCKSVQVWNTVRYNDDPSLQTHHFRGTYIKYCSIGSVIKTINNRVSTRYAWDRKRYTLQHSRFSNSIWQSVCYAPRLLWLLDIVHGSTE